MTSAKLKTLKAYKFLDLEKKLKFLPIVKKSNVDLERYFES